MLLRHASIRHLRKGVAALTEKQTGKESRAKQQTGSMAGTEYTDGQRRTGEVASTAYTGSDKKKVDLQNDRLETGGF